MTAELPRHRLVAWVKENGYGVELVDLDLSVDRLTAGGVAIGWEPIPYRLDFTLETGPGWVTTRLNVTAKGDGWSRTLDLRRSDSGVWTADASAVADVELEPAGGDPTAFAEALDWPGVMRRIEYRSRDFVSELLFDADGLVVDYPQLGRAVP